MDHFMLDHIVLMFKHASAGWAPLLAEILRGLALKVMLIGWFFTALSLWGSQISVFPGLFRWLILNGFLVAFLESGWAWVDDLFVMVTRVGEMLGAPPLSPSSIAALGGKVSQPVMKAIAAQGWLSYLSNPLTYTFELTSWLFILAFWLLAAMLLITLIFSFLLSAAAPFFVCALGSSFTRGLSLGYFRMVMGTMATLFMIMLVTVIIQDLGNDLTAWLQQSLVAEGLIRTLTWTDALGPMVVGLALCMVFVWIPLRVGKAVGGIDLGWEGGHIAMRAGGMASSQVMAVAKGSGGGGQSRTQTTSGGGSGPQPGVTPWGRTS